MVKKLVLPCFVILLVSCAETVDIEGIYLLEEYRGETSGFNDLVGQLGYVVQLYEDEEGGSGLAFIPVVLVDGEFNMIPDNSLSDPPWRLLRSNKNRYTVPLPLEVMYSWEARAKTDILEGRLQGSGEKGFIRFRKVEQE